MSTSNRTTIDTYEANIPGYVNNTPHVVDGGIKDWMDKAVEGLTPESQILELGSGFGRDADYFEEKGLSVERTDATQGFVDLLKKQGHNAASFNPITQPFDAEYDLVFANAVLLHFDREEAGQVIQKSFSALRSLGLWLFLLKKARAKNGQTKKSTHLGIFATGRLKK